jgi:LuxR family maltose regulon positive regulatory protein
MSLDWCGWGRGGRRFKPTIADARIDPPRATGLNAARELAMPDAVHHAQGSGLVTREGLLERLSGPGTVVLVCAPAGSGKTVLVRSWVEDSGLHTGWVSVERGERDGQRFWLALIDALAAAVPAVERVDPAPSFQGEALVERLLADLALLEEPAVLVVDDLHELQSAEACQWLEVLLARRPPALRVVLSTREEPRLGLHRLRLAGELIEVRAPDLRFSLSETRQLLQAAGIELSDRGVTRLYARTEGWAAGLRLAAISLARHPDPERFVAEFSGSERTVAGYLVAEVLERQPEPVRELLLRTSLLDRVSGPLADHLTGASGSERVLQELEDANAFVSALDVRRSWFRYHHLFADLLQLELRRVHPELVDGLHRAAAGWFEEHGMSWRRSVTRRRRATGGKRRVCCPRAASAWSSTAAWPRSAPCWTRSRPAWRPPMPSSPSASRACGCARARSTTRTPMSPSPSGSRTSSRAPSPSSWRA